jgi:hypothetical protein
MSSLGIEHSPERVQVELGEADVPLDAIYGAACSFTDRCFVRLDRVRGEAAAAGKSVRVTLRAKPGVAFDAENLALALENEIVGQALRERSVLDGEDFTAALTAAAFGAPESAPDPLADLAHFDDPLGIAESWDKQHAASEATSSEPSERALAR